LTLAPGSTDVAFQFDEPRTPQIGAGQIVVRRVLAIPSRCPAIGQGGVAIQFGLGAFAGSGAAIGQGGVAIQFGLGAFAGSGAAISQSGVAIEFRLDAFAGARSAIL
jgi:hypothetical protein